MPVAEHLLDGHEIDTSLVVVGGTGMAQTMRAEAFVRRCGLELEQVAKPVADRAPMDRTATLVAEQCLRRSEARTHVVDEPVQDQVELVEHRHPARAWPRSSRGLPEADVDLAERAPSEVQVGKLQRGGFVSSQTTVIERAEQCVVPSRRSELACRGDPVAQEREELLHPLG